MIFLSNAPAVLGLVGLMVAAIAVAYSALIRTTIATLKDSNAALTERVGLLEQDRVRDQAEIKRLTTENQVLRGVVSGTEQLAAIRAAMLEQHQDQMTTLNAILGKLETA